MAMSRDRVRFDLPITSGSSRSYWSQYRKLCKETLGVELPEHQGVVERVEITCRPSQFARFLIRRNDLGLTNSFKMLNASLIPAPASSTLDMVLTFDASRNPNRVEVGDD